MSTEIKKNTCKHTRFHTNLIYLKKKKNKSLADFRLSLQHNTNFLNLGYMFGAADTVKSRADYRNPRHEQRENLKQISRIGRSGKQ